MSDAGNLLLQRALDAQRQTCARIPVPGYRERVADLRTLQRFLLENREALIEAVSADYGNRSRHETLFGEMVPVLDGIKHTLKHLRRWMRPQRRAVDFLRFPGARNRVLPQPLGVVGVIVPWNYPINLLFMPLTSIFAAGNCAMVKMSENSRHLAALLIERLPRYFPAGKLAVFDETGGVGVEFSRLPVDHLLFTGSTADGPQRHECGGGQSRPGHLGIGRQIAGASVRGFSPAHCGGADPVREIDECRADLHLCGLYAAAAVTHCRVRCPGAGDRSAALPRPIEPRLHIDHRCARLCTHYARVGGCARTRRYRRALLPGKPWDESSRKIAPHLVIDPPADSELLQREIFGPLLPIVGYENLAEAVAFINARPRPLAFYPFSRDRGTIEHLIEQVMSGGVSVNDVLWHVTQHDLPFGGVGASGMGHYHGREGFVNFSKLRPVFYQARWNGMRVFWPPFGALADKILDFLTR